MMDILKRVDWRKVENLLPVVVQEDSTNEVLMMAFMDKEALELTIKTKKAHYFSRTKQRIWQKGESSGNFQIVKDIFIDCDNDTILLKVEQIGGVACHTGRKSCFFTRLESNEVVSDIDESATSNYSILDKLYHELHERKSADPKTSYTASLLQKGENSYLKKIVEEAGEFCFAVKDNDKNEIVYEAADLVYHIFIPLIDKNIHPDQIKEELKRRFGTSGIEEKKSRKPRK
jgi:phosphoribosyl-ATP pyrophosphohydrolase/phosphoribosyl-AMP cyclohydrolase